MKKVATFVPIPARGHIPFKDSRTQKQVREDEEAYQREMWKRGAEGLAA